MARAGRGLHNKYTVLRNDGEDSPVGRHPSCDLFVLDVTHDMNARKALSRYADLVEPDNAQLAHDLRVMLVRAADVEPYR